MLVRMRIGSFYFAYRLAGAGITDHSYIAVCPCYGDFARENIKHTLIWSNPRAIIICDIILRFENLQEDRIFQREVSRRSKFVCSGHYIPATYLSFIVHIRDRPLESLAS